MPRFEITGGNGRAASLDEISAAIGAAGGLRVARRRAFGWGNQPHVITFAATDETAAREVCKRAAESLWPSDGSCMATLLAFPYGESRG
jgi:hypothetical protein